ncbi:MAG: SDR family oxidoreductase [Alphaproteobacteria bacterium]|nr:SDR family oxidoreductase [Alphaproteobacteria bacterium]
MKTPDPHLFCFGLGFSGQALARLALARGWQVSGTVRSEAKAAQLQEQGINALVLDTEAADRLPEDVIDAIRRSSHLLQSVGTARSGDDPVLPLLAQAAEVLSTDWAPDWFGYLSTTVVYGDWQGDWVSEDSETRSTSTRGLARLRAEAEWTGLSAARGLGLHVFRLAGIYGPGRNALETVFAGKARIIDKPDQVFSRIHVEDIATAVFASMTTPTAAVDGAEVFNICDDEPCPPGTVIAHACDLLDRPVPTPVSMDEAGLSAMGHSFYADNKRVSNRRLKDRLGWSPAFPTYREGLAALLPDLLARARSGA